MQQIKDRIVFLRELIKYHDNLYQNYIPEISDADYDELYYELQELEEKYPELADIDSPTQKLHYEFVTELKKVKHEYQPMLSLDKTKDIEEIKSFIGTKDWIAMLKLDGLTCRLTYEEGKLVRAETRGDGVEGEDITHNARVLPSIPQSIDYYDTLVVDGEVICDLDTFEQFKDEYANARNFAAGSIRLLDSKECAKRGLTFVAWDCIRGYEADADLGLHQRLSRLIDYNFYIIPFHTSHVSSIEEAVDKLQAGNDMFTSYPIDGIVFKWNNCAEYEAAGRTEHHFRGGMAYKFYDEEYETELLDLEYTMGKTGVLSPVAIYKTIVIDGAECSRASLHNLNTLTSLLGEYPYVGQKIKIFKANQIIPQVSSAIKAEEILGADPGYYLNDPEIKFLFPPKECPICGAPTEVRESDSGTIELYCSSDTCEGKLVNRLEHFAGKKGLDIKGLSKATFEKLIDWGWIKNIRDIFSLADYRAEWVKKSGFGDKSVDKILNAIDEARHCTLAQYLSAISIPLIGKTYAQKLADFFETYEEFRNAVAENFVFETIEGIGPEKADAIWSFDYYEADRMYDMKMVEIVAKNSVLENSGSAQLAGAVICVTGKLKHFKNRDELASRLTAAGAKVTSAVSSKTTYLVNNDVNSTSSKNKTAKELGIAIITEEQVLEMLK